MVDILHRVGVKAPIDAVYKAVATREGVAGWWTEGTAGESTPGGTLTFRFTTPQGVEVGVFEMKVLAQKAREQVLWEVTGGSAPEWIGTRLVFDLKQEGEHVILLFRHEGWKQPVEFMHHCSTKWAIFLMSLKQLVETGRGLPAPHDTKIDNWN
jgi:uncharacterized protein YndB with AHSA1/START domain